MIVIIYNNTYDLTNFHHPLFKINIEYYIHKYKTNDITHIIKKFHPHFTKTEIEKRLLYFKIN